MLLLIYNKTISSLSQQKRKQKTRLFFFFFKQTTCPDDRLMFVLFSDVTVRDGSCRWKLGSSVEKVDVRRIDVVVVGAHVVLRWEGSSLCECCSCVSKHSSAGSSQKAVLTRSRVHYRILVKRFSTDLDSWKEKEMKSCHNMSFVVFMCQETSKDF